MHSTLVNLWLFAQVIAKVSLITGLAPGAAVALAVEYFLQYRSQSKDQINRVVALRRPDPERRLHVETAKGEAELFLVSRGQ